MVKETDRNVDGWWDMTLKTQSCQCSAKEQGLRSGSIYMSEVQTLASFVIVGSNDVGLMTFLWSIKGLARQWTV